MNFPSKSDNNYNFELLLQPPSTEFLIRRYLARYIDVFIAFIINSSLILFFWDSIVTSPDLQDIVNFIISHYKNFFFITYDTTLYDISCLKLISFVCILIIFNVLCALTLSLMLFYFGNTIGKALLKIEIINKDMYPPTFKTLFFREMMVLGVGNAFKIKFISLIHNILAFIYIKRMKESYWDQQLNTKVIYKKMSIIRWYAAIILAASLGVVIIFILFAMLSGIMYSMVYSFKYIIKFVVEW